MIIIAVTMAVIVITRALRLRRASDCGEASVPLHTPSATEILPHNRSCCMYFDSFIETGSEPVASIPPAMMQAYSLWGKTRIEYMFFNNKYAGESAMLNNWTADLIDKMIYDVDHGSPPIHCNYPGNVEQFIDPALLSHPVNGKRGCVIGSETPWLEALLLARGATHITTIEYGVISSTHPKVTAYTPAAVRRRFMDGRLEPFDFCFSYSSLEHSGLGRYGDRLQPFGDFEMLERVRCMLKPDGLFYIGVPTSDTDCLVFNAHRVYGPERLSAMSKGRWDRLSQFGSAGIGCDQWWFQPVHVWQKATSQT